MVLHRLLETAKHNLVHQAGHEAAHRFLPSHSNPNSNRSIYASSYDQSQCYWQWQSCALVSGWEESLTSQLVSTAAGRTYKADLIYVQGFIEDGRSDNMGWWESWVVVHFPGAGAQPAMMEARRIGSDEMVRMKVPHDDDDLSKGTHIKEFGAADLVRGMHKKDSDREVVGRDQAVGKIVKELNPGMVIAVMIHRTDAEAFTLQSIGDFWAAKPINIEKAGRRWTGAMSSAPDSKIRIFLDMKQLRKGRTDLWFE